MSGRPRTQEADAGREEGRVRVRKDDERCKGRPSRMQWERKGPDTARRTGERGSTKRGDARRRCNAAMQRGDARGRFTVFHGVFTVFSQQRRAAPLSTSCKRRASIQFHGVFSLVSPCFHCVFTPKGAEKVLTSCKRRASQVSVRFQPRFTRFHPVSPCFHSKGGRNVLTSCKFQRTQVSSCFTLFPPCFHSKGRRAKSDQKADGDGVG